MSVTSYKFFLDFVNTIGEIEISEPVKFDGATFIIEQDAQRYGRDISFMNESIDLFFYDGIYDASENPLMLPNGTIVNNMTMGFTYLLDALKDTGFESEVRFTLKQGTTDFVMGVLDFQTSESDYYSYVSCKVIQNTEKQIVKRREDLVVDMFSDEDIDGNPITPLSTTNILLKAKPFIQQSAWNTVETFSENTGVTAGGVDNDYFNPAQNLTLSGIANSLTFISPSENDGENFAIIEAVEDLTDVEITIDLEGTFRKTVGNITSSNLKLNIFVADVFGVIPYLDQVFPINETINNGSADVDLTQTITVNFDAIPRDYKLWIYFECSTASTGTGITTTTITKMDISIKCTSTAIDTVIKGVRYIDMLKQTAKSISGLDVYAPRFDVGGQYYEQFAFTGNLIKRRDDVAFPVKFKEAYETLQEVNSDYQITDDLIYIGQYLDFYPNKEIGAFLTQPDQSFKATFNERFAINQFEFGYTKYEQDKDENDTIDAVHTQTQWSLPNKQVENNKKIDLKQIRDPFKIETARKEAIKTTTSTSDDDSLFLIDVVPLAPNYRGGFTASMTHNVNTSGQLQLLKDADLPSWAVLGFDVGGTFFVNNTTNSGTFTVAEITDTIITLDIVNIGTPPLENIDSEVTNVSYFLNNVIYTNRTNEQFTLIENIENPDKFSNLLYTPKRNIQTWLDYIKTACRYRNDGIFRNTYFRNNGKLETTFLFETTPTIEEADVNIENLGQPRLTPVQFETKLIVPFADMVETVEDVNTINVDDTIGGFIRCIDSKQNVIKLFPKKLEYEPATETLTLTGEEYNQGEYVTIKIGGDVMYINDVTYPFPEDFEWFETNGDYFVIFDNNNLPIINPVRYDKAVVNAETFDSIIELSQKLIEILN